MKEYLIPHEGRFYKANLHSHSTVSDGRLTPQEAKELYKSLGYSVYAYTDHNVVNYFKELSDPEFLVLCGYELDCTEKDGPWGFDKTRHLCAIARDPERAVHIPKPASYDNKTVNETIRSLIDAGYIVNYNHPGWSSEEPSDFLPMEGITAMEIYNSLCEVARNNGDARLHYDIALKHGKRWYCIAADDNHNPERKPGSEQMGSESGSGWTMIKSRELTYPAVISAFEKGEFYCSTGPEIHELYIEDGRVWVECSPVCGVFLMSRRIGGVAWERNAAGTITRCSFELSQLRENEDFFRLELVDARGKMAFTNPYFTKH